MRPNSCLIGLIFFSILFTHQAFGRCMKGDFNYSVDDLKLGPYRYEARHNSDTAQGYFTINRGNLTLFEEGGEQSQRFYVNPGPEACGLPVAGKSITGENRAELAVLGWSGGAHCCFTLYIYALGNRPYLIQKVDQGHSDGVRFVHLSPDPVPEIIINDWTFAYWKISFAKSPAPEVILKYNGQHWAFSPDLMRKPLPSTKSLSKIRKSIAASFKLARYSASDGDTSDTGAPVVLWSHLIRLIYTGHADTAWSLLNDTWPQDNPNMLRFAEQFHQRLAKSAYYVDLQKMNPKVPLFLKQ